LAGTAQNRAISPGRVSRKTQFIIQLLIKYTRTQQLSG